MLDLKGFTAHLRKIWSLPGEVLKLSKMLDSHTLRLAQSIDKLNQRIGEHTVVHADIHWKGKPHQIIVCGKYKNRDFVKVYDLDAESFVALIHTLEYTQQYAKVGHIDTPGAEFSVVYPKDQFIP